MSITIEKIIAALPTTRRGQPTQLSADPKGERIVYASGKSIFVRSIDDPSISKQYTSHTAQTTVARFSPSGFYIASGDVSGIVRVWDAVEAINTKGEYSIISGRINDIAWDGDSQRIIAVGDGRERFGHCITADSGNTVGEISGHASIINSVSIRQQRPLRAATGSDDSSMVFMNGAPFKFATKLGGLHKGYVYGVAFSPDGNKLVTVGADKRIQLYDGKTGEATIQLGEGEHTGSIFGVSWAPDSKKFATASADQTVKIWDAEAGKCIQTWQFGKKGSVPDQQVGIVWPAGRTDGLIISLSLSGDLNYLSEGKEEPLRHVQGHGQSTTSLCVRPNANNKLWTGSLDGRICNWEAGLNAVVVTGTPHTNKVTGFADASDGTYSIGWDDTLRTISDQSFIGEGQKLTSQPKEIAAANGNVYVAMSSSIDIFSQGKLLGQFAIDFTTVSIAASGNILAVADDINTVYIYTIDAGHQLSLEKTLKNSTSLVFTLRFSPSGTYLAAGNSSGKIIVYDTTTWEVFTDRWSAHSARVTTIAWNEEGTHAASGSLDTNIFVWSLKSPGKRVKAPNAHKDGVNGIGFIEGSVKLVSIGADAALKVWKVENLQ